METAQLPLAELIRLGLTGEFRILAGRSGLQRPITWVNAIAGSLVSKYQPAQAEFILLVPPYSDLPAQLRRLAKCHSSGVSLLTGELPDDLLAWAEKAEFPIIALPDGSDLLQLQRNLLRLLVGNEAGLLARKAEIYQHLTHLTAENQGLEAIARALAEITGKGILIHDKRLQVLAAAPPRDLLGPSGSEGNAAAWERLVQWSSAPANLPAELLDRKRAGAIHEPLAQSSPEGGARLVVPIIVHDIARGFLSIVNSAAKPLDPPHRSLGVSGSGSEGFDQLDRIALEQGAAACALEMAKAKAVSEAQKRLTGDLIEAVLTNSVSQVDAGRWAERSGYRRAGPHVAMALQWTLPDPETPSRRSLRPRGPSAGRGLWGSPTLRRLETIVSGEVKRTQSASRAVAQLREDEIVLFYAMHPERGFDDARQWAQRIYDLAQEEFPNAHLAFGIGRPSETILGLRQSYREAAQAMALEHKLRHKRPQYFGDLGIYRLLLQLEGSPELRSFSGEILSSLIEYDRVQGMNLVETLSAYFQHNANLAQTAQALYVHRNTLLYRLQRASEIGKFDLDNPETRLAIQLALRAYELSRDESDFLPPL